MFINKLVDRFLALVMFYTHSIGRLQSPQAGVRDHIQIFNKPLFVGTKSVKPERGRIFEYDYSKTIAPR